MTDENGIVTIQSRHSVADTVGRLQTMLAANGIRVFDLIDHSGAAEEVGLQMKPCRLLIFGNPKAGTPLMLAAPTAALDLPLKILVWEKNDGSAWLSYNDAVWLQRRHNLPADLMANISMLPTLAARAAD